MKIEIKNMFTDEVIICGEYESLKDCLEKNREADLSDACLDSAYLRGVDFRGVDFRGAYLRGANLRDANLGGAYLGGANLRGAYLGDANLRGAKNYSESHDIFFELVRRYKVADFTNAQWSIIGQLAIHRLCWDSIKKRFGKKIVPIFKLLAKDGFDEYLKRYKEVLNDN